MAEATAMASSFYPHQTKKLKLAEDLGHGDDESVGRERTIYAPEQHLGYAGYTIYSLPGPQRPVPALTPSLFHDPIFDIPLCEPFSPPEPEVAEMLDMLTLYDQMDLHFAKACRKVYRGHPLDDKVYLFLFCELKGVDANYQQVLADKDIIGRWWKPNHRLDFCRLDFCDLMNSSIESIPKSVFLAKQIIAEKDLELGSFHLLECLEDLCSIWKWEQKQLRLKKYEEFLLYFWTQNLRKPKLEEIGAEFCTGLIRVAGSQRKVCTILTCANPGSGKYCVGPYAVEQVGQNLLERLSRGDPPEECLELIEENYKNRMSKPYPCRAHYIKSKLHEAEKTGLAEKIRELIPSFKDLAVRDLDMDQEKLDLRGVGASG